MARIPDVVPRTKILTAWGNLVRDRTVTPFINAAERDAAWPAPPIGALCVLVNEEQVQVFMGTWMRIGSDVPVGSIIMHGASAPPEDFLLCSGQSYLRSSFPDLFAVIGTSYGAGSSGDGTTFNVPNLTDRVPVGASAGRPLGSAGGEATHVQTTSEMAYHGHAITGDGNHTHGIHAVGNHIHSVGGGYTQPVIAVSIGSGNNQMGATGTGLGGNVMEFTTIDGNGAHAHGMDGATHGHAATPNGGNVAMSLMQPYQTVNYIIRARP